MKIDLTQKIPISADGNSKAKLGMLLEKALFEAQPGTVKDARQLYNTLQGKKEADLKVEQLADLKKATNSIYINGVAWAIEDILEGQDNGSK